MLWPCPGDKQIDRRCPQNYCKHCLISQGTQGVSFAPFRNPPKKLLLESAVTTSMCPPRRSTWKFKLDWPAKLAVATEAKQVLARSDGLSWTLTSLTTFPTPGSRTTGSFSSRHFGLQHFGRLDSAKGSSGRSVCICSPCHASRSSHHDFSIRGRQGQSRTMSCHIFVCKKTQQMTLTSFERPGRFIETSARNGMRYWCKAFMGRDVLVSDLPFKTTHYSQTHAQSA